MTELNEDDIQLIIDYVNGMLTGTELTQFEQRCQNEAAFRAEVERYEEAKLAAIVGGKAKIKAILKDEAAKYQAEQVAENGKIVPLRVWILRGVAAATLIGAAWWALQYFQKSDTTTLYATHFMPLKNDVITQFRDTEDMKIEEAFRLRHDTATLTLAKKAFQAYARKEYGESITYFNQIQTPDDTLTLYKANAFLAINHTSEANALLTQLSTNGKGYTQPFAEWYLALAYLKEKRVSACQALLIKIKATPNHPFVKEAEKLNQDIQ
jgi:hypothetical protein